MTCLETCIVVLVIGFTVLVVSCGVISRIFEENRKRSERAALQISEVIDNLYNATKKAFKDLKETEKEIYGSKKDAGET